MKVTRCLRLIGVCMVGSTLVLMSNVLFGGLLGSAHSSGIWYVATNGSDSYACSLASEPCATINAAIGKASPTDMIFVAGGVYTSTAAQIVLIDRNISLSGGWNDTFSLQNDLTIIDGEDVRRGILVNSDVTTEIENFVIQNGRAGGGGGIFTNGIVELNRSSTISNTATSEGGGVFVQFGGTLIANQSSLGYNQANSGGAIFSAWGTVHLNNTTLHHNFANGGGGINNLGGVVSLNSTTITKNRSGSMDGGGIRNEEDGTVSLQNTIIAGNSGDSAPDCSGSFVSQGYNLLGDDTACNFTASAGDQVNVPSGLFPYPMGSASYYSLMLISPAIDAGNPAGCTNHQGMLIGSDQRSSDRSIDGTGDGNAVCDIGAYEYDPEQSEVFLISTPCTLHHYCQDFFDDFSNPASGWELVNSDYELTEYLNGEYRVFPKQANYTYYYTDPTCSRSKYVVEVDARWASPTGGSGSYGILFGVQEDYSQLYTFEIDTGWQYFRVSRNDSGGRTEIFPFTYSSSIKTGTASNHLKLTWDGVEFKLEINGSDMGTWSHSGLTGSHLTGVIAKPYNTTGSYDARFDNFSVKSLP